MSTHGLEPTSFSRSGKIHTDAANVKIGQASDRAAVILPRFLSLTDFFIVCCAKTHTWISVYFGVFHLMTSLFGQRWSGLACLLC